MKYSRIFEELKFKKSHGAGVGVYGCKRKSFWSLKNSFIGREAWGFKSFKPISQDRMGWDSNTFIFFCGGGSQAIQLMKSWEEEMIVFVTHSSFLKLIL